MPSSIVKRWSIARPSNQWLTVWSPRSQRAGPVRSRLPAEPRRKLALQVQLVDRDLVVEVRQSQRGVRRKRYHVLKRIVCFGLLSSPTLTPTSAMVLGFLRAAGPSTPYDLKQMHALSVGHFWSIPHSQLYAEPERLAKTGLVSEEREDGGRRRRRFTITPAGEAALDAWLADPQAPHRPRSCATSR